ncbi:long-chain-fatty-acid--CoA ligase ACSBG2-like isoform X2 [Bolinopsis microptera]|uniref:long-chain-fatty-acid--CoA ligase ACSBG2-like isoform X2 n=1 Tax=Bolinopsis microptera TaxID=2820187 RepID=UPI00307AE31E
MTSKHWTADPDGEVQIKKTLSGPSSVPPRTIHDVFLATVTAHKDSPALKVKRTKGWATWTYNQYYNDCSTAAKAFIKLGLQPASAVCIMGFNAPEWFIADIGSIMAGGIAAGIYTTNSAESCKYILSHSKAQFIVVENRAMLDKILQVKQQLPSLLYVIVYDDVVTQEQKDQNVLDWDTFMKIGSDIPEYELQWRLKNQKPNKCSTLIYTSGTTGPPKAVMLSHDNISWTALACCQILNVRETSDVVSYLPLSHIAAQIIDLHGPMACGATVWFAKSDALKGTLVDTLQEVRPTMFLGVPRVWEKIQDKVEMQINEMKGFKRALTKWAQRIGTDVGEAKQNSTEMPRGYWMADRLVFNKIKQILGLDRCILQASAAAPITQETIAFFQSLDIPVYEIYGMSECSGPQTLSFDGQHKAGSTGKSIPGSEIKIEMPDRDGNGEICYRGRHIFMGYMHDEDTTSKTVDKDGWLHSGDIGKLDKNNFLTITGRIKEIIITAGGENIAPIPIEDKVKQYAPIVSNCMVIGDKMKFLSLVCTLRCVMSDAHEPLDELDWISLDQCRKLGSCAKTVSEALMDPLVLNNIKRAVQEANKQAVSNASKIQKFRILPEDFSIGGGELGPTLKLKRRVVMTKYADIIDEMYEDYNERPPSPSSKPERLPSHASAPSAASAKRPESDSSTEDKIIAQHLDELSLHLEQERVAQLPGYRSRTSSQLSEDARPPFPPLQTQL